MNFISTPPTTRWQQLHCYHEALRATKNNRTLLALCWRLVADASRNFSKQHQANEIFYARNQHVVHESTLLLQSLQEAHDVLKKPPILDGSLTPDWIFDTGELQPVAESYRYFLIHSQAQNSHGFSQEIEEMTQTATKYILLAPEVAFFTQEAAVYFKKIHECSEQDSVLKRYRLLTTGYAAVEVATIYLHVEASLSWNNKILIHHWKEAARYGEHAFHFRIRALAATQQGDEMSAIEWSLAAAAATQVCDAHATLLDLFPRGDQYLITHWNTLLHASEEAMEKRTQAAAHCEKKRTYWNHAAFWAEHYHDCYTKVIEHYSPQYPRDHVAWEKIALHAKEVSSLWSQAALQEERKHLWLSRTYYQKRALRRGDKNKKMLFHAFGREVFFCIPQNILSLIERSPLKNDEVPSSEVHYTVFYNWIYQTWKFLKEAGIPCHLSSQPVDYGIMITLCEGLPSSFGKDARQSHDLFIVDIVADTKKQRPAADCYLLQNRAHTCLVPNALFMPHWPQPGLIPRDPIRGKRFKNICFFGEIQNLAPELTSPEWSQRLFTELGLHFEIRTLDRWHDYRDVDCVVAIRDFSSSPHFYKPATKLYNAWLAGVPFIGGSDSAYASDGKPGKDYLVATSLEELFRHLKRLQEENALRAMLVRHGIQSSKAFTKEATLERWSKLIQKTLPALMLHHPKEAARK
ncbi:MAG: hypothetical protein ACOYK6_06290 [Chthoniobacterales bacterium]